MSHIQKTLEKQPGFVGYLTAGDGGLSRSKEAMLALIRGGVNVLEVGVPFSDPVADGATIEAAAERALKLGTSLEDVLQLIRELREETDIPIILFSYYNPILQAGKDFYRRAREAGVDGFLMVDLPIEESDSYCQFCEDAKLDPVFLISPSTPIDRIKSIQAKSKGMLYYVCRSGTTGVKDSLPDDFKQRLSEIKAVSKLPVVAGFGISNRKMAEAVLAYADGFVVGSLFVNAVAEGKTPEALEALAASIKP
jgi:tryptophan synthase alpha chain